MRADRLVAVVLLLQVHGRLTAAELAARLETSERTIRRDLDALCMAGVPLYAQRGRGGGWTLLGGHRIDLSGLTTAEAQALFLATAPGSVAALGAGVGEGLAAARRKVLAALPERLRAQVEAAGATVLVDPSSWGRAPDGCGAQDAGDDPHVAQLRAAVLAGVQVVVGYEPPDRPVEDRRLHPLGLVCKRGVWYLLAGAPAGLRTYRVSRVRSVTVTGDPAERPAGFDLAAAWAGVQRSLAARVPARVEVVVAAEPPMLTRVRSAVGAWWPVEDGAPHGDGRSTLRLRFATASVAAAELAPFGEAVEVVGPEEVRAELAELGRRLVRRYAGGSAGVV